MQNMSFQVSTNGPPVAHSSYKLAAKSRRLQRSSISIKTDATSAANQKPVLVDQATQCDSPYTSLTTEQIRLTTGSVPSKGGLLLAECLTRNQTMTVHGTA